MLNKTLCKTVKSLLANQLLNVVTFKAFKLKYFTTNTSIIYSLNLLYSFIKTVRGFEYSTNAQFKKVIFLANFESIVKLKFKSILKTGKDLVTINGQLLKTRLNDYTIHINQSKLINRDVMATNGVIHSVDSLIRKGYCN